MKEEFTLEKFFQLVEKECKRQDEKWGIRNMHPLSWNCILTEEVGEVAMEINDANHNVGDLKIGKYEEEIVQSAAVLAQMFLNIKHYLIY